MLTSFKLFSKKKIKPNVVLIKSKKSFFYIFLNLTFTNILTKNLIKTEYTKFLELLLLIQTYKKKTFVIYLKHMQVHH